jgi:hypothetical protein
MQFAQRSRVQAAAGFRERYKKKGRPEERPEV